MDADVRIYAGVTLPSDADVGPFVLIGVPPRNSNPGDLLTLVGEGAVIRSHTVIYAGNRIGARLQTGHGVMLREQNIIGDDVSIGTGTVIEHHVTIGNRVRIHSNAFIPEFTIIEDDAWIGPNVVITNARYPLSPTAKATLQGPRIRRGAKIGANSTLLPGIEIGESALIGAGSVVTRNVEPAAVVAGNPAKVINTVTRLPY